jgi:pimeloyl-ACP methyl ester carboxylesterase
MEHWVTIRGLKLRCLLKGTGAPFVLLHFKNAEAHVIKGAGHACYMDRPEEFSTLLREFLNKTGIK